MLLGILGMGGGEMGVIVILALLLFGGKKIPELMKGLGQGIREFKDASNGTDKDKKTNPEEQPKG